MVRNCVHDLLCRSWSYKCSFDGVLDEIQAKSTFSFSGKEEFIFVIIDHNHPKLVVGQPGLELLEMAMDHEKKQLHVADKWITPKDLQEQRYRNTLHWYQASLGRQQKRVDWESSQRVQRRLQGKGEIEIEPEIRLQDNQKAVERLQRHWSEIVNQQVREDLEWGIIEEYKEANYVCWRRRATVHGDSQ